MAAYKAGMKTVIIPKDNLPDLEEVDDVVKENVEFVGVSTLDEVLPVAFVNNGYLKSTPSAGGSVKNAAKKSKDSTVASYC